MKELSKEMQLFLVSTVFGYDMKEDDNNNEKLKLACIERAYLDLARVIPYKFSSNDIVNLENKNEIGAFLDAKKCFKNDVHNILLNENGTAGELIYLVNKCANSKEYRYTVFKEKYEFTYGMSQKWVNMFNKYMWLFSEGDGDDKKYDMPIDSYIIDALYKMGILNFKKEEKLNTLLNKKSWNGDVEESKRPSNYIKPWSKWNEDEYLAVQALIKNNLPAGKTILSWENKLWMEQALELRKTNN